MWRFLRKYWKISSLAVLIAASGMGWWVFQSQAASPEPTFISPQRQDLIKTLNVSGAITADNTARLRFIAGGKLVYLSVEEGDWVDQWQRLASIDQATLQKQLQQDLNNYMKERWDNDQLLEDNEDRWLPSDEVRNQDKSQWDLENSVINVEIRDIAIRNQHLTAPFEGIVTKVPATTPGVQLLASDYFEIVDPRTLVFRAEVDEADIGLLRTSQRATITLDSYPDQTIETYLDYISVASQETSSGTVFMVEFPILGVENLNYYKLGMNGDIAIEVDRVTDVITLPIETLIQREGVTYVNLKADNQQGFTEHEIEIGLETEDLVEVVAGLSPDDQVVFPE